MTATALAALAAGLIPIQPPDFAEPGAVFVAVVLDDSGSMGDPMPGAGGSKMAVAKTALAEVFGTLPPSARVGLYTLNATWTRGGDDGEPGGGRGTGYEAFAVGEAPPAEAAAALGQIVAGGGTPLGARLADAAAALAAARAQNKYGEYRLLVVTDGEASDAAALDAALPRALGAGLTVDVIGVAMRADHSLATRVDSYRRADDPAALAAALSEVLAESAGGADDGAGSDYDVIAPLPEPLAAAALAALADDAPPDFNPGRPRLRRPNQQPAWEPPAPGAGPATGRSGRPRHRAAGPAGLLLRAAVPRRAGGGGRAVPPGPRAAAVRYEKVGCVKASAARRTRGLLAVPVRRGRPEGCGRATLGCVGRLAPGHTLRLRRAELAVPHRPPARQEPPGQRRHAAVPPRQLAPVQPPDRPPAAGHRAFIF